MTPDKSKSPNPSLPLPPSFLEFLEENGIDPSIYTIADTTPRYIRLKPGFESDVPEIEAELKCKLEKVMWLPCFYAIPPDIQIAGSKAYKSGKMYGMDAASGAAVVALDVSPGDHVLDLCAAPGAKLCMLSDVLGSSGSLTGVDVARDRLAACRTMLQKYALGDRCRASMSTTSTEEPAAMSSSSAITVSAPAAVGSCAAMAFFYVALLYSPTVILRLPPPSSLESFLIRRFACAAVSSAVSAVTCALLLGIKDFPAVLLALGIRKDHMGQAVAIPLFLTSLLYAGTIVSNSWGLVCGPKDQEGDYCCGVSVYERVGIYARRCLYLMESGVRNILFWRNYVVAPFTEELVFRACMIPLLLCGGFKTYSIIFFCPIFFSLAHLNHFLELYYQQRYSAWKAFMTVGLQLGYTVIFGWYAAFLFIRTGNLLPPIVAHIFCNMMGLPVLSSPRTKGAVSIAFVAGLVSFFWLLFPATNQAVYNDTGDSCSCWHGYCNWN